MSAPIQLSHSRHTGRLLPRHHTSYGGLVLLLGVVGWFMVLVSVGILAPSNADSGTIGVSATVPGAPPSGSPSISSPADGATLSAAQLAVSGVCDSSLGDTIVLTDNGADRGSAFCSGSGFSIELDLGSGSNALAAHYLDSLNQSGPSSATVTVTYTPTPAVAGTPAPTAPSAGPKVGGPVPVPSAVATGTGAPLSVTAPDRFTAISPGDHFSLIFTVAGGVPPYAIEIDWGDHTQSLLSLLASSRSTQQHVYQRPGQYTIRVRTGDGAGTLTVFQTTLTVNGTTGAAPAAPSHTPVAIPAYELKVVWPIFLATCLAVFSFWIGERYDRRRLHAQLPVA